MKKALLYLTLFYTATLFAQAPCAIVPEQLNGRGLGTNNTNLYWPNGVIPYLISIPEEGIREERLQQYLASAIELVNQQTNVCFVPVLDETDYLDIVPSVLPFNFAQLGYVPGPYAPWGLCPAVQTEPCASTSSATY
ncbi:MAG: hypothetical protein AAF828_05385 [Bacteroidota bacterium]